MLSTLALDPGRNCTGWAFFAGTRLVACGLSVLPEGRWKLGEVVKYHCQQIERVNPPASRVFVEEMSLNRGRDGTLSKAIATANDLLQLQSIGAFIAGRLGGELVYVPPAKHDKKVTQNRVVATLEPSEKMRLDMTLVGFKASLHHNLYDSVLHGLRAVGRYG